MFEKLRQTLNDLMAARGTRPEERRELAARMKETLVLARVGLDDLRKGVAETRARLEAARRELETVVRRKTLAAGIDDAETVRVAERYEQHAAERVAVLERKLAAQEGELALGEREVEEMTQQLRAAMQGGAPTAAAAGSGAGPATGDATVGAGGGVPGAGAAGAPDPLRDELTDALDSLARQRRRSATEAEADARLAELKRRMGK